MCRISPPSRPPRHRRLRPPGTAAEGPALARAPAGWRSPTAFAPPGSAARRSRAARFLARAILRTVGSTKEMLGRHHMALLTMALLSRIIGSRIVLYGFVAVAVGLGAYTVAKEWHDIGPAFGRIGVPIGPDPNPELRSRSHLGAGRHPRRRGRQGSGGPPEAAGTGGSCVEVGDAVDTAVAATAGRKSIHGEHWRRRRDRQRGGHHRRGCPVAEVNPQHE